MDVLFRHRGRELTSADVAFVREFIAARPEQSRRQLSRALCAAWGWVQPNGVPRDAVCRSMLLALARAGHIVLPPVRSHFGPAWRPWVRRPPLWPQPVDQRPLGGTLAALGPLALRQVRRSAEELLVGALLREHHPLRYVQPVGEHLKFLAYAQERPLGCFTFRSAPRHLCARDRFIGWSAEARRKNIRFVAYNSRFLIVPWVRVPHLASHLLGRIARTISAEWQDLYGHPVYLLETFVDPARHRGTCYRAAGWLLLGQTRGRGKDDREHRGPNRSIKQVLAYPLVADFRERLGTLP